MTESAQSIPAITRLRWFSISELHLTSHPGFGIHYEIRAYPGEDRRWEVLVWQGPKSSELVTEFSWTSNITDMAQRAMEAADADFGLRMPKPESDPAGILVTNVFLGALAEAYRAMRRYPQPNYNITKVAEEAGEVIKAAVHCAEGRDTPEHVIAEIRQTMAMLIRLYVEGDQVHGLAPLINADRAEVAP